MLSSRVDTASGALQAVQATIVAGTVAAVVALACGWYGIANPGGPVSEGADERGRFLEDSMRLLVVLSALGIIAAGAAVLIVPTCAALR